jgi:protein-L-isoaspartate(D-aspartate) O-methyltransferase
MRAEVAAPKTRILRVLRPCASLGAPFATHTRESAFDEETAMMHAMSDETPRGASLDLAPESSSWPSYRGPLTDTSGPRARMFLSDLVGRGITDTKVLAAFRAIRREAFVPPALAERAYADAPLGIGEGQTISQPYIVALMMQELALLGDETALEVGTGSGFAAAVLSLLTKEVYTIERLPSLATSATERLERLGFANVHVTCGDGSLGLPEHAPYDVIAVAARAVRPPERLLQQLTIGGRLVIPVGEEESQMLVRVTRYGTESFREESLGEVRFVPLISEHA